MKKKLAVSKGKLVKLLLWAMPFIFTVTGWTQNNHEVASKNFYIGIDNSGDICKAGEFFNPVAMDSLGVDFVVYHYKIPKGTIDEETRKMEKLETDFQKANLKVIVNVECGNWALEMRGTDGYDWVTQPGNLHLFKFPYEVLKSLNQSEAVWGVQYDELEHSQITRNLSITIDHPGFELASLAETTGMSFKEANYAVYKGAKQLVDECENGHTKYVLTEHVWPVLFHNFARAGITPVYKQMKENWSNVWEACAVGACLQYNRELWSCLDFWRGNVYPGHSAEELWSNLLFAYWAGVDKVYVEAIGDHTYEIVNNNNRSIRLKERGKVLSLFAKKYVIANPRTYTFRDYEPEIAIIRFDDTEWGQGTNTYCAVNYKGEKVNYYWKDWLFGAYNLRTSPESEEWIKAWHTISHGKVSQRSLSWNAGNVYEGIPYRCFAPVNSPIVFDNTVTKKYLQSVKLAFLCGLYLSKTILNDVSFLVRNNGLVVVTSKRFAPDGFAKKYSKGTIDFNDGKGKWIITDDMASDKVKKLVAPWLGNNDEITLRFKGNRRIVMKISPDGKELHLIKNG